MRVITNIKNFFILTKEEFNWSKRIKKAFKLFFLVFIFYILFSIFGFSEHYGSEYMSQDIDTLKDIWVFGISLLAMMPLGVLIEEFFFRFLPYRFIRRLDHKYFWPMGIVSSLLFAWIHGYVGLSGYKGLPAPQLIAGLYLWRYIPSGFKNAFWIHYFYNTLVYLVVAIGLSIGD